MSKYLTIFIKMLKKNYFIVRISEEKISYNFLVI